MSIKKKLNIKNKVLGKLATMSFVVSLSLFGVMGIEKVNADFTDFKKGEMGQEEVEFLHGKGIIQGYPDGSFKPEVDITRRQAVVMLGRAFGWGNEAGEKSPFADVSPNDFAFNYIYDAYHKGLINGYQDGTFKPDEKLTRAQMAALLERAFDLQQNYEVDFKDVGSNYWANKVIQSVASNRIVVGYGDGTYRPEEETSRKHFSMMLARALDDSFKPKAYMKVSVDGSRLNVRDEATTDSDVVGKLYDNIIVQILDANNGWAKVKYKDIEGYASLHYMKHYRLTSAPLEKKVIILDAGHGGKDSGASYGGLIEKEINLKTTRMLKSQLENLGATVFMTREDDTFIELVDRAGFAKPRRADLFISIHSNASASHIWHGTETFYNKTPYEGESNPHPANSEALAKLVQLELGKLPTKDLGIKDDSFQVLRKNTVPSILVELGFIDNPNDIQYMKDDGFLQEAAEKIAEGINQYYNGLPIYSINKN